MIFDYDILYNIIEFDPSYTHKLVSKQFNYTCNRLSVYMKVWNLKFDFCSESLDYIHKNILNIQKWGSIMDILWYKHIMNLENQDINIDESVEANDIEYDISICDYSRFEYLYNKNIDNLDISKLYFYVGYSNNIEGLRYLHFIGKEIDATLIYSSICESNKEILQYIYEEEIDVSHINLSLPLTIRAYGNNEILKLVNDIKLKKSVIPDIIYPDLDDFQQVNYLRGLKNLNKEVKHLNFNNINTKIYFLNIIPFYVNHKHNIELIIENRYYDTLLITSIINTCLKHGFIDLLDVLWNKEFNKFPNSNIVYFILKHNTYLCLPSLIWIEKCYTLHEKDYIKIFQYCHNRDLNTAIYCLKKIKQRVF